MLNHAQLDAQRVARLLELVASLSRLAALVLCVGQLAAHVVELLLQLTAARLRLLELLRQRVRLLGDRLELAAQRRLALKRVAQLGALLLETGA